MAIIVSEMPRKAAGVSGMNAGLPRKQPVCADVKQTRRNQCSDLLVLGARAILLLNYRRAPVGRVNSIERP